jgi:hypothetical protein
MSVSRRIYFSMPHDDNVTEQQQTLQWALAAKVEGLGYVVEVFARPRGKPGLAAYREWSRQGCDEVARRCCGAVFIGTPRWVLELASGEELRVASEYAHYEAGVIETLKLPRLMLREEGLLPRVVFADSFGGYIARVPQGVVPDWLDSDPDFKHIFTSWCSTLEQRRDVFLGYCSNSADVAGRIKDHLAELGASVLDWKTDFAPAGTIFDQIVAASERCSAGIFLFTKDDPIKGKKDHASPRDNVVFEAGYFAATKGKERVLIVREAGSKMPADLGGDIYAFLEDRADIGPIKPTLEKFLETRL